VLLLMPICLSFCFSSTASWRFRSTPGKVTGRHYNPPRWTIRPSMSIADAEAGATRLEAAKKRPLGEIAAHGDGRRGHGPLSSTPPPPISPTVYHRPRPNFAGPSRTSNPRSELRNIEEAVKPRRTASPNPACALPTIWRCGPTTPTRPRRATYVPTEGVAADVHLFSDGRFPDAAGLRGPAASTSTITASAPADDSEQRRRSWGPQRPAATTRGQAICKCFVPRPHFFRTARRTKRRSKLDEMDWKGDGELKGSSIPHIKPFEPQGALRFSAR